MTLKPHDSSRWGKWAVCVCVCVYVCVAFWGYSILKPRCRPLDLGAAGRVGQLLRTRWQLAALLSCVFSRFLPAHRGSNSDEPTHTYTQTDTHVLARARYVAWVRAMPLEPKVPLVRGAVSYRNVWRLTRLSESCRAQATASGTLQASSADRAAGRRV